MERKSPITPPDSLRKLGIKSAELSTGERPIIDSSVVVQYFGEELLSHPNFGGRNLNIPKLQRAPIPSENALSEDEQNELDAALKTVARLSKR